LHLAILMAREVRASDIPSGILASVEAERHERSRHIARGMISDALVHGCCQTDLGMKGCIVLLRPLCRSTDALADPRPIAWRYLVEGVRDVGGDEIALIADRAWSLVRDFVASAAEARSEE
jgi:hypothetical protein